MIFSLLYEFFFAGIIYDHQHEFLFFWFAILFYNINIVNFQNRAILLHGLVVLVMLAIYFVPFLDFSVYAEQIQYFQFWKYSHLGLIFGAIIVLEFVNASMFERIFGDMLNKNIELENYKINQLNIQNVKDNFFTTISHEMRTPLNAIKGISDLLISQQLSREEVVEFQKTLNYSSNHLLSLVNDVLDYSKINLGEFNLSKKSFNLEESIQFVYNVNRNFANQKQLIYTIEKWNTIPMMVIGDVQRFNQILMNLISNAIKFTHSGFVEITFGGHFSTDNNSIFLLKVSIKDSGIGIEKEHLDNIFNKYYQAKNQESNLGIGLGLYISKMIINLMNGQIQVSSKVGSGTVFDITLPFEIANLASLNHVTSEFNSHFLMNLNVLIVEDNQINQLVLKKLLIKNLQNCQVKIVKNGLEAIKELEKNQEYDVVLMDIIMPIMDGYEASKIIRASNNDKLKNIPIIAITANVLEYDYNLCYQIGINEVITKPFEIEDVFKKMYENIK
ncbi:ATP-binding protein [Flavobacterium branchiophilum]|nr:ATP-binding protein [Flavobacterium branchiophilum]